VENQLRHTKLKLLCTPLRTILMKQKHSIHMVATWL